MSSILLPFYLVTIILSLLLLVTITTTKTNAEIIVRYYTKSTSCANIEGDYVDSTFSSLDTCAFWDQNSSAENAYSTISRCDSSSGWLINVYNSTDKYCNQSNNPSYQMGLPPNANPCLALGISASMYVFCNGISRNGGGESITSQPWFIPSVVIVSLFIVVALIYVMKKRYGTDGDEDDVIDDDSDEYESDSDEDESDKHSMQTAKNMPYNEKQPLLRPRPNIPPPSAIGRQNQQQQQQQKSQPKLVEQEGGEVEHHHEDDEGDVRYDSTTNGTTSNNNMTLTTTTATTTANTSAAPSSRKFKPEVEKYYHHRHADQIQDEEEEV